ncbi:relaxase/mobilization nuclease domain-containing protein [Kitasatospora sp. CMC57]|uniref:Relaxase/mobilization nuclease domain-containing protein n=1 Tax=Kitasatospora sp. CMC57 TaxID=3231513 RepID=A0AB33JYZ1_9ACTN
MIASIGGGSSTKGLLKYLFGPGEHNEHDNPHIVGSWDGFAPDPGREPGVTFTQLRDALDLRVVQAGERAPKEHVWHCSVRTASTDRLLADEEWDHIAQRIVAAAGVAPEGDPDGCRWIAVRHADDHIHILATLVRGNLTQPRIRGDWGRVENELTLIENELGLFSLAHTRTKDRHSAPKRPTRAELRKAERRKLPQTPRETLRTAVRQSLAGAATEEEFLRRLAEHGIRTSTRRAPSGDAIGYKFALPGDRNAKNEPVWFSGSKLDPDLSLPKIRARLAAGAAEPVYPDLNEYTWPASGRYQASTSIDHALVTLADDQSDGRTAATISGSIEILDALATTSPVLSRKEITQAARDLDRAGLTHTRAAKTDLRAMCSAARAVLNAGPAIGRAEDGAAAATILSSLVLLAIVIAKWHAARGHEYQAQAANAASDHLRAAYARHAAKPMAVLDLHGGHLPQPAQDRQAAAIRQALPADQATRVLNENGWTALAATLAEAEAAGHDPAVLLAQAAGRRELASADSATAVLTWRIRRDAGLPTTPAAAKPSTRTGAARTRTTVTGRTVATPVNPAAQPQPLAPPAPRPRRR